MTDILIQQWLFFTDLSAAVQKFSQSLQDFQFECIGDAETDDEINIGKWLTTSLVRSHTLLIAGWSVWLSTTEINRIIRWCWKQYTCDIYHSFHIKTTHIGQRKKKCSQGKILSVNHSYCVHFKAAGYQLILEALIQSKFLQMELTLN